MIKCAKIEIRGLNCFYNDRQVVDNINMRIMPNAIVSILGPANSGITTLLRCLNRINELKHGFRTEGEILLDGKSIFNDGENMSELRRKVGMVFDVPTPLPMSVFDNIAYGPRLSSVSGKNELSGIVERALITAALWDDVKDRLNVPAMTLSGGQQQRLCIARALALEPDVVLLDRPCSGLDPLSTAKIEESLIMLKERFTIVIAPHNVQQAARISDRVAFMLMGVLVEEGPATDIFNSPKDQQTSDFITGRFG
jgi:phosphate transport system ATP-binding protein